MANSLLTKGSQRLRLLELFSGASGAGMGYHLAGYDVTAVDINPQPNNPHQFIQADAIEVLRDRAFVASFDAIHTSPTCQTWAAVTDWRGSRNNHPDLLTPTLDLLQDVSVPWVVENVPEAATKRPLRADFLLCGTQFGLKVRRHRAFQIGNWTPVSSLGLPDCSCYRNPNLIPFAHKQERAFADALGCTWMTAKEGRQAIPPAYTEFIGLQMLNATRLSDAA